MFIRLKLVLTAMMDALSGKVQDPEFMLESTYKELQANLIAARKNLANAIRVQLELRKQAGKNLEEQRSAQDAEVARLQALVTKLENEVQKTYTTFHMLDFREFLTRNGQTDPSTISKILLILLVAIIATGFSSALFNSLH